MKNSKGFTLVELLAVSIILGLIALIVTPIINNILEENRQKLYNRQIESIVESAKTWGAHNFGRLPSEGDPSIEVTLGELKHGGFADKDLKNPKTDLKFNDETTKVVISNKNGILTYEVIVE